MAMSVQDHSHEAHGSHSTCEDIEGGSSKQTTGDFDGASSKQITGDLVGDSSKQITGSCTHFSIRGYVSEARKKNWKSNCPFSVPDDSSKLQKCEDWLPPLLVNKASRWWACRSCLKRSEAEAIPINDFDRNDKEPLHLCFEIPTKPRSNGIDNEDEMVQLGNDHSRQENIVGAVHEGAEQTIETSDSDIISLDLNRPAYGPSDEVECSLNPASADLEVLELGCGHFTRVSDDQGGCLDLFRDMVGARNGHLADVSNKGIILPVKDGILELSQKDNFYKKTRQVDFGIEGIDVSLRIGSGTNDQYKESNHVRDSCLENREELVGDVRSRNKKYGFLKPKKAPKIRSLTDILINTKELPSFNKLKNKKQAREIGLENTEQYPTLSRCLAELQKARQHERQNEMRKVKTISVLDEPEHTEQSTPAMKKKKKKKKKNKASSFHDEASAKASKISNMITDSTRLALGSSHEKIKKGISRRSKLKTHNYEQRRGGSYNGETDLLTEEHTSIPSKNEPKKSSPKLHPIPQNKEPEREASAASREGTVDDDIPMEIVELLARNRLARRLNSLKEAVGNWSNPGPDENYMNRSDSLLIKDVQSNQMASSPRREAENSIDLNNQRIEAPWISNQFTPRPQRPNDNSKPVPRFAQDSSSRVNPLPSSCAQFLNDCRRNQMATQNVNDQFYRNQPALVPGSMPYYNARKRTADMSSRNYIPTAYMQASMMPPARSRERYPQFSYPITAEGTSSYENVINPLRRNDSISALNLLMLMQQGASSSTPSTNRTEKQNFPTAYPPKPSEHEAFTYGQYPRHSQSHQVKNTLDLFPSFPTLGRNETQSSAPCEDEIDRSGIRCPFDYKSGYATSKQNYALKNCRMGTANQSRPAPRFLLPRPDAFLTATGFLEHLSPLHLRKTLPHLVATQNKIQFESSARSDGNCCVLNRNPADLLDTEDNCWIDGDNIRPRKASRLNYY